MSALYTNTGFLAAAALALLLGGMALVLVFRAKTSIKPICIPINPAPASAPEKQRTQSLRQRLQLLRRVLFSPNASRYDQQWIIMLGELEAGKSSLINSLSWLKRHVPTSSLGKLPENLSQTSWYQFPGSVLIDPAGCLTSSQQGSAQDGQWLELIQEINTQRPERPLDGVVLVISARTLLRADSEKLRGLATVAKRQLNQLREQTGMVLPVYAVLSQCDAITGFSAYWQAMPATKYTQINGWSAKGDVSPSSSTEWIDVAWREIRERLNLHMIRAAAGRAGIENAHEFFQHGLHFEKLLPPLREYLSDVFPDSAWDKAHLCRGIYLTGCLENKESNSKKPRKDVSFVDDLFLQKVLAEKGLARATRQSIWSRDQTIRKLQYAVAGLLATVAIAVCVSASLLWRQADDLQKSLRRLQTFQVVVDPATGCISKNSMDESLTQAAALNYQMVYLALPLSWVDRRVSDKVVDIVSDKAIAQTVLPAMSCALEKRATALHAALPLPPKITNVDGIKVHSSEYMAARAKLALQASAVYELELGLSHFERLASRTSADTPVQKLRDLNWLSQYLYAAPLPSTALQKNSAVQAGMATYRYSGEVMLPKDMRKSFARQLKEIPKSLHAALEKEIRQGQTLLGNLNTLSPPLANNTALFATWLNWVNKSWLPSDPIRNPCFSSSVEVKTSLEPLVATGKYPASLLSGLPMFSNEQCYLPMLDTLKGMKLSPYGALASNLGAELTLNPLLQKELQGLMALLRQSFMLIEDTQPFACLPSAPGWRTVDIGRAQSFATDYQSFITSQSLSPTGAVPAMTPLYQRIGSAQLELVMNDALRAAQSSAGAPQMLQGIGAVSASDQQLHEQSESFKISLQPLNTILGLYVLRGFTASAATVRQCARGFSTEALARISALADQSRLYQPDAGTADGALLNLASANTIPDYLSSQLARTQVLKRYAEPFVAFLGNTDAVNEVQVNNTYTLPYWKNTINELDSYVRFKEPAGHVSLLEALFTKTLADLTYANCTSKLGALPTAGIGNDLFWERRQSLILWLKAVCADRESAIAIEAYTRLADRFNKDLARRYPFATLDADDASLGNVKAFFLDYDAQRAQLRASLANVDQERWRAQLDFITQLDRVAAFLRGNLATAPASQPIRTSWAFHVLPAKPQAEAYPWRPSPGSEQIVNWRLTTGPNSINFPGANATTADWAFGQPISINFIWADRSVWRPAPSSTAKDLRIDGTSATFMIEGEWALLRMIEKFRPRLVSMNDAMDANRLYFEFVLPVVRNDAPTGTTPQASQTVLYLAANLTAIDTKSAPIPMQAPSVFPREAPAAPLSINKLNPRSRP